MCVHARKFSYGLYIIARIFILKNLSVANIFLQYRSNICGTRRKFKNCAIDANSTGSAKVVVVVIIPQDQTK